MKSILEGGVQRAGDRVRINVQLIDAGTDAHLWAESYDRELTAANIFAIQSEVAAAIAGALKATLTPAEKARVDAVPTRNLEAWEAYQLGKQRMAKRTSEGLAEAEKFFRKAIDLDPTFALAYVGLADTLRLADRLQWQALAGHTRRGRRGGIESARSSIRTSPKRGHRRAGSRLAGATTSRLRNCSAGRSELNPNYAAAHQWLSLVLTGTWTSAGRTRAL